MYLRSLDCCYVLRCVFSSLLSVFFIDSNLPYRQRQHKLYSLRSINLNITSLFFHIDQSRNCKRHFYSRLQHSINLLLVKSKKWGLIFVYGQLFLCFRPLRTRKDKHAPHSNARHAHKWKKLGFPPPRQHKL